MDDDDGNPERRAASAGAIESELDAVFGFDLDEESWVARLRGLPGDIQIGRLGPYELLGEIGRGGQGIVYKARQPRTDRVIALKRVAAGGDGSASFRMRFEREIRTTAALNHPNIVTIFGCDTVDGQALLLMEFIDGLPVDRWVESLGAPGEPGRTAAVVALFGHICRAVAHAHQHGIIHRDLKPRNVLVVDEESGTKPRSHEATKGEMPSIEARGDDGTKGETPSAPLLRASVPSCLRASPKVLDFGLARLLSPYVNESLFQTHTTGFVGTPAYASPEHFADDGAAMDVRSDIYAIGVMLYQALTGFLPYDRNLGFNALMKAIQERDPPRPSSLVPRLARELELIVLKALAKEKSQRYQSMDAFADDLRRYAAGETVLAHPPTAGYQFKKMLRRHKLAFSLSMVILLLVAGFAVTATVLGLREHAARQDSDWNAYIAGLAAASAAIRADDAASAQQQLERAPARLRGWEWDYFSQQADGSLTSVKDGRDVVAVDDRGQAVAAINDEKVWISSSLHGGCSAVLRKHHLPQRDLSADLRFWVHRTKLSGTDEGRHTLTDVANGRTVAEWPSSASRAPVLLSPDGRTLAIAEHGESVRIVPFTLPEGQETTAANSSGDKEGAAAAPDNPIFSLESAIEALAFSRDGRLLACGNADETVQIVDVAARRLVHSIPTGERAVWAVAFSPDATRLATGSWEKKVTLWNLATEQRIWTAEGHGELISALAFSPDGSRVASGSKDNTIRVWDAATGRSITRLVGHTAEPVAVAFLAGNDRLVSYDGAGILKTWRVPDHDPSVAQGQFRRIDFLALHCGEVTRGGAPGWLAVSESVDESWRNPRVSLVDPRRRRKLGVLWEDATEAHNAQYVTSVASPDGRWLAVGSSDGRVLLWRGAELADLVSRGAELTAPTPPSRSITVGDPQHRGQIRAFGSGPTGPACWPTALSFGADDRLALSRQDGGLEVWDIERQTRLLDRPADECQAMGCALSPDGERLAWAACDRGIHVLSVASGRIIAERAGAARGIDSTRLVFSPDGGLLVTPNHESGIALFRPTDLTLMHLLQGHADEVSSVAFSPDGTRLVSSSNDGTLKVWDVASGRELATLHGHKLAVNCVTFSADGKTLISGGQDNTVRFWDAALPVSESLPLTQE